MPLGNGFLGAMVYGTPDCEVIEINEESLWSGRQIREEYSSSPEILKQIQELLFQKKIEEAFALCEKQYEMSKQGFYFPEKMI